MSPLQRLAPDDLPPGTPLRYSVFDESGKLLFGPGVVIGSIGYLRLLISRGLYRRSGENGLSQPPEHTSGAAG